MDVYLLVVVLLVSTISVVIIASEEESNKILQFEYSGKPVNFTVPENVTFMTIDMAGGRGDNVNYYNPASGGKGGRVQAVLNVSAGMEFVVEVGGRPIFDDTSCYFSAKVCTGGFGGGGSADSQSDCAPGGGGSYLYHMPKKELIVAVGGGGGACGSVLFDFCPLDQQGIYATRGGDGGGLIGETVYDYCVGTGGNQTHGGRMGEMIQNIYWLNKAPYSGSFKKGGSGFGGGGGGGYYGGGAAFYTAGGGGSSFVSASSLFNAQGVIHTQGYSNDHGYMYIVFNELKYLDVTKRPTAIPTATPSFRPFTVPTRRPTAGVLSPSETPTMQPSRRPTQAPVTSSPTFPFTVPVIAPTPAPSVPDDDYTTCNRDNLKFFSGDSHDRCADELFGDVYEKLSIVTANINYLSDSLRFYLNHTNVELNKIKNNTSQKLETLTQTIDTFLRDIKYKEPTAPPSPAPTRRRRSRSPTTKTN